MVTVTSWVSMMFVEATDELKNLEVISFMTPVVLPLATVSAETEDASNGVVFGDGETLGLEVMGILRLLLLLDSIAGSEINVVWVISTEVDGLVIVDDVLVEDESK